MGGQCALFELVAVWNNDVRLPLDIKLDDGRLVAQAQDTDDLDFEEWEPIGDVVSKFTRLAQLSRRPGR